MKLHNHPNICLGVLACALMTTTVLTQGNTDLGSSLAPAPDNAGDEQAKAAALVKATLNPIASLISLPLQNNFDWGAGPNDDGFQYKLNVQPVIPISLNEDWNVISRTIVPYVYQDNVIGTSSQSGLADTVQSLFFSPVRPTARGWIWGAGPVLQLPTATDDLLGEEKWGAGPTAVVLKQEGRVTYGALVNQVWSFAGEDSRTDVSRTFLQPFVSYTTKTFTTLGLNAESTYDWEHEQWTVPLNAFVQQLLKVGKQPISVQLGGRYYADGPSGGPEWGLRFQVSLLFPK
jgi:hypothetical protein